MIPFSFALIKVYLVIAAVADFMRRVTGTGYRKVCEYKINSFPPQLRKPAWLMDGIKWMKIKMFHEIDDKIELNGKNGREKSK